MSNDLPQGQPDIQGTQTYLIECNRGNSVIDATAPESNNAKWTTKTDFRFKRGDRVGVEAIMIESSGAGSSTQTIEFSGDNVKVGEKLQDWTDDVIILEFGFYINNNGNRTMNLPFTFKHNVDGTAGTNLKVNRGVWTSGQTATTTAEVNSMNQFPGCSCAGANPGYNFKEAAGAQTAYDIYEYQKSDGTYVQPLPVGTNVIAVVISKSADAGLVGLAVEYSEEKIPWPGGTNMNGRNTQFAQGMVLYCKDSNGLIADFGIIEYVSWNNPPAGPDGRLYIRLSEPYIADVGSVFNNHSLAITSANTGDLQDKYGARYGYSANPFNGVCPNGTCYQKGARIGIGLYNGSAPFATGADMIPDLPTAQQGMNPINSRLIGGSFLWEQTRVFGAVDPSEIPEFGNSTTTTTPSAGMTECTTNDLRNYKDNAPYIIVSPEYSGPQPTPNGRAMQPMLEPMTAYVIIKANSSFEDVNNLATKFTEAFHAINPLLTGEGNQLQEYIDDQKFPFNKMNNTYPLTSRGFFGPTETGAGKSNSTSALWNRVSPLWIGNLVKCLPANLSMGINWKYQPGSPYFYHPQQAYDYLKVGNEADWQWCNLIYGNMALKDFAKCWAGDRIIRCDCWDGNTLNVNNYHRDIPRPVLLNTQFIERVVDAPAGWTTPATFSMTTTDLNRWEVLLTNIYYIRDTDDVDPDDPNDSVYRNLDYLQEAFRHNEKYMVDNPYSQDGEKLQQASNWWEYEMDIGMADGSLPINAQTDADGIMTPLQSNWNVMYPASAAALPHPSGHNDGSHICPSQSIPGVGSEVDIQKARDMGRVKCFSRWFDEYGKDQPLDSPIPPFAPLNPLENPTGAAIGSTTAFGQIWYDDGNFMVNPQPSIDRNIGVIPYIYNDDGGEQHTLCAFVISRTYKAEKPSFAPNVDTGLEDLASGTSSWLLGNLGWGDFFGWSPQFGYDQPAIVPMNPDKVAGVLKVAGNDPALKWKWNNQNFMWVGANNALMTFDNEKNRFSLSGLYTENTLSKVNASTTAGADTPQVGEVMATLNSSQNSSTAYLPTTTNKPADYNNKNQSVEDSLTGVFLNNVYFAPKNWTPPTDINPQNLFNPYVGPQVIQYGSTPDYVYTKYSNGTTENRKTFLAPLTKATPENWAGNMLDKMGFDYNQIIPPYGSQSNRYSQFTYGRDDIEFMYQGKKPLMLNAETDVADDLYINVFTDTGGTNDGTPLYQQGLLNNQPINIGNVNSALLTANRIPTLFACPFYLVISDICPTQFQSGSFKQDCIFYGLKNYGAGQYFYVFGSSYSQLVDQDRTITQVNTEIRNPLTGRLARLSKNSCIIYKVERDIRLPGINIDATGTPIAEKTDIHSDETTGMEEELKKLLTEETKTSTLISTLVKNEERGDVKTDDLLTQLKKILKQHNQKAKVAVHTRDMQDLGSHGLETKSGEGGSQKSEPQESEAERIERMQDIHSDLIKMVIVRAMKEIPITKGFDGNIGNTFVMNTAIHNALQKYSATIAILSKKAEDGEIDIDDIRKHIADENFSLGVKGQIVSRRRKSGKGGIELGGYIMQPALIDALAKDILHTGGSKIKEILDIGTKRKDISLGARVGGGVGIDIAIEKDLSAKIMKGYKNTKYLAKKLGVDEGIIIQAKTMAERDAHANAEKSGFPKDDKTYKQIYRDTLTANMKAVHEDPMKFVRRISQYEGGLTASQMAEFHKVSAQGESQAKSTSGHSSKSELSEMASQHKSGGDVGKAKVHRTGKVAVIHKKKSDKDLDV